MKKRNLKILKLLETDSWSDSAGEYSIIKAIVLDMNKEKEVTFFVCSDYPNQLTIWNGWEPDFYSESILLDINIDRCDNKSLIDIHDLLLAQIKKYNNKMNAIYFTIDRKRLEQICLKYSKNLEKLKEWEIQDLINKAIDESLKLL